MSQNQNVPAKGSIIINPNTNRPIKVGGRAWLSLVKQGLVSGNYTDDRELATVPDEHQGDNEYVEEKIKEINKTLPRGQQSVRGRGKYKGKIVSRSTQPTSAEISKYTAQIASRAVSNNINELVDSDDLEGMLEKLIMDEMLSTRPASAPPIVTKKVGRPKKNPEYDEHQYETKNAPEYEDDDGDNYEEEDYHFDGSDFE